MSGSEADVKRLAHDAEVALEEVAEVVAEYIAPLIGFVFGWILGPKVGGIWMVGNAFNGILNPKNDSSKWALMNTLGGVTIGAVFAILGGCLWGASRKVAGKKWSLIGKGLLSFIAGTAFGMAAWAVVTGFQGLDSNGWLDNFAGTTLVSAADKVAPSGGA